MKLLLIFAVGTAFALPAQSQSTASNQSIALRDLIAGKSSVPLALHAKDLNENFARFHFSGASKKNQSALMPAISGQINSSDPNRDYFTKGDTLKLESGTYLIAYALEVRANITPGEDETYFDDEMPALPQPIKIRTKDKLLISLLDLRNLGNLTNLRPFDADSDMESETDRNQAVVRTLKLLGQHLIGWLEEQDESKWPAWGNLATPEVRQHFNPYAQSEQMWQHPSTGEFFGLNPALAKKDIWEMPNQSWVYMAYERTAAADGARAVLFADGHVERVQPDRWERVLKVAIKTGAPTAKSYDVIINPLAPPVVVSPPNPVP